MIPWRPFAAAGKSSMSAGLKRVNEVILTLRPTHRGSDTRFRPHQTPEYPAAPQIQSEQSHWGERRNDAGAVIVPLVRTLAGHDWQCANTPRWTACRATTVLPAVSGPLKAAHSRFASTFASVVIASPRHQFALDRHTAGLAATDHSTRYAAPARQPALRSTSGN